MTTCSEQKQVHHTCLSDCRDANPNAHPSNPFSIHFQNSLSVTLAATTMLGVTGLACGAPQIAGFGLIYGAAYLICYPDENILFSRECIGQCSNVAPGSECMGDY